LFGHYLGFLQIGFVQFAIAFALTPLRSALWPMPQVRFVGGGGLTSFAVVGRLGHRCNDCGLPQGQGQTICLTARRMRWRLVNCANTVIHVGSSRKEETMIRKLKSGEYRLYSRKLDPKTGKRRNLGTFKTREAAEKHEREVQYFKRH